MECSKESSNEDVFCRRVPATLPESTLHTAKRKKTMDVGVFYPKEAEENFILSIVNRV
jgi:hypothetical protein